MKSRNRPNCCSVVNKKSLRRVSYAFSKSTEKEICLGDDVHGTSCRMSKSSETVCAMFLPGTKPSLIISNNVREYLCETVAEELGEELGENLVVFGGRLVL